MKLGSIIPKDGILKFEFPPKIIFQNSNQRPVCFIQESLTKRVAIDCDLQIYAEDSKVYGIRTIEIYNMCKQYFKNFCPYE